MDLPVRAREEAPAPSAAFPGDIGSPPNAPDQFQAGRGKFLLCGHDVGDGKRDEYPLLGLRGAYAALDVGPGREDLEEVTLAGRQPEACSTKIGEG